MSRLNRVFIFFVMLFLPALVFSQKMYKSDTALFGELNSAYKSASYPVVIDLQDKLESQFPHSQLIPKGKLYKGQSLIKIYRYQDAENVLATAITQTADKDLLSQMHYSLGKALYFQKKYSQSIKEFFTCAVMTGRSREILYLDSIRYCALAFYFQAEYKDAIPLFEEVISNGKTIPLADYQDSFLKLFDSYMNAGFYKRLVDVYENIPQENPFYKDVYYELTLYAGDACDAMHEYKTAYSYYAKVLKESDTFFASIALQKSYAVAQLHPRQVGQEPGELLASARLNSIGNEGLLAEFWTRLGIDSFNAGNYSKAKNYFDNAEKVDLEKTYSPLTALYRVSMEKDASSSLALLAFYKDLYSIQKENSYYFDYLLLEGKFLAAIGEYDSALACINPVLENARSAKKNLIICDASFWEAYCLYQKRNYSNALLYVQESYNFVNYYPQLDHDVKALYSRCLSKNGQTEKARLMFETVKSVDLTYTDLTDYSKLLFLDGYITACLRQSQKQNTADDWYMTALSSFNKKDFFNAEKYFSKYISSGAKQNLSYARFYLGYSQYKLGENAEAFKTLSDFLNAYPNSSLSYNAAVTATNAALQQGNISDAEIICQKAVDLARSLPEKQNAVSLVAGVYTDALLYDKAVQVLMPYSKQKDDFGLRARYQIAQIYAMQGKVNQSDKMYLEIQTVFPATNYADESAYRRGELYYNAENYSIAINRFSDYQKKFPFGQFVDAAIYYTGESYARTGQTDKAILQYLSLTQTASESSYIYNAKKNLVTLYRLNKNYEEALRVAEDIMSSFPEQSRPDGISELASELRQLTGGADEAIVKKQSEYEKKGASSTREGRIAGTELCELLWKSDSTKEQAYTLAKELSSIQTREKNQKQESLYAARTLFVCAQYERSQDDFKNSADTYIKSATYARMCAEHILAQKALYGAVEAFSAARMNSDARLTYENLQKLYPDSDYAQSALQLLK